MPWAPPPARRSTLWRERLFPRAIGSSARAEIDPGDCFMAFRPLGLLRPRGDRPHAGNAPILDIPAPPPARRSTQFTKAGAWPVGGSSARAEIDPWIVSDEANA